MAYTTNKRVALLVATLASFFTPFMGSSVNIALPSIAREFSLNTVLLSWIATSYLLSAAMFLVPLGKIADIYGRKKIFLYGITVYTCASFLSGISTSIPMLIISRIIQGFGGAMIFGTGIAILTSVFPEGERGKALGINVSSTYLGLSLGPVLGGFLTQHFGWRSIFYANVPLGLIIIILVVWKLRGEWAGAKGEKFDFPGSVMYSLTLVSLMYGFSILTFTTGKILIPLGIIGILLFIWWEMRVESPVLTMNLFKNNRVFMFSNLSALINYSATFTVGFLLSLYLQYIKGLGPQNAGLILISQPVVMAMFSPIAGRLSDRIEPRIVASSGMAITVIGLSLFIFLQDNTTVRYIVCSLIIIGFGFALFSSPNTNAIMSSVDRKFYGVSSAMLATMRLVGNTLSMGISTLIFALHIGKVQITQQYNVHLLTDIRTAFVISACICFCGIFASLVRGNLR